MHVTWAKFYNNHKIEYKIIFQLYNSFKFKSFTLQNYTYNFSVDRYNINILNIKVILGLGALNKTIITQNKSTKVKVGVRT